MKSAIIAISAIVITLFSAKAADQGPDDKDAEVLRAQKKAKEICADIEKIRGLAFKKPVKVSRQNEADFNAYIRKNVETAYGKDGAAKLTAALTRLGLLKEDIDLVQTYQDLGVSQIVAHYDPFTGSFHLIAKNVPDRFFDMMSAHELCHALQDQHYDLKKFLQPDPEATRNSDQESAMQFLIEGEASYIMTIWMLQKTMNQDLATAEQFAATSIKMQAAMNYDQLVMLSKRQAMMMAGDQAEQAKKIEKIEQLPRIFVESLYAAYMRGANMVAAVKAEKGWKGVDALFSDQPQSTEQVLHPEKLLKGDDPPIAVDLSRTIAGLKPQWQLAFDDVVGELGISIYLSMWGQENADTAAGGWGGDRYYYLAHKEGKNGALIWQTTWDSPEDAKEFHDAFAATLAVRFPKATQANGFYKVSGQRQMKVTLKDKIVTIIDSDASSLLDLDLDPK